MISPFHFAWRTVLLLSATAAFMVGAQAQNTTAPTNTVPPTNAVPPTNQALSNQPFATSPLGGNSTAPANNRGVRLLTVEGPDVSSLRALAQSPDSQTPPDIDAVSLGASLADLRADAVATQALLNWVRDGGVVFLHTDAAQLFGYQTVAAREATNELAGQRFGRAEAALPLGLHPMLWGQGAAANNAASTQRAANAPLPSALLPGVRVVFYQMAPGDHLVVSHPTGVPLLEVTDLAAPQQSTLFASCAASYGRGWAVFTPYFIEQNRADGAVFVRNLLTLVRERPASGVANRGLANWVAIPATTIDSASDNAVHSFDPANWMRPFLVAALGWDESEGNEEGVQNPLQATLFVTQREANGISRLLDRGRTDAPSRVRAQALLILLRARLEWQRGNDRAAQSWLNAAARISSGFSETLLWRGIDSLNNAEDLTLPTADRVAWWRQGANFLAASLQSQSLLALGAAPQTQTGAQQALPLPAGSVNASPQASTQYGANAANNAIAGMPRGLIQSLITSAGRAAARAVDAPSSVEVMDDSDSLLVLRHENGAGLNYFGSDAQRLAAASNSVGLWMPRAELWIFPDIVEYNRYLQSEGFRTQNFDNAYDVIASDDEWNSFPQDLLPGGFVPDSQTVVARRRASRSFLGGVQSDALSTRLITVAPRSPLPSISRNINPVLSSESLVPLGELHGRALVETMTQDGAAVPVWMEMGIALMAELQMTQERWNSVRRPGNIVPAFNSPERNLPYYNREGWLLNAAQFRGVPTDGTASTIVKEQALGMMRYFYREFGAGAAVETLQRLGSGQSADNALLATTGLSEEQFFQAWAEDMLGTGDNNNRRQNRR